MSVKAKVLNSPDWKKSMATAILLPFICILIAIQVDGVIQDAMPGEMNEDSTITGDGSTLTFEGVMTELSEAEDWRLGVYSDNGEDIAEMDDTGNQIISDNVESLSFDSETGAWSITFHQAPEAGLEMTVEHTISPSGDFLQPTVLVGGAVIALTGVAAIGMVIRAVVKQDYAYLVGTGIFVIAIFTLPIVFYIILASFFGFN